MSGSRAGLALLLLSGCGRTNGDAPDAPPAAGRLAAPPTIVLITLDTLRRDHLGCYGYFRDTTPHIDALAAESVLFERALASMASTLPSHLTMLTGLYPYQHGMLSNRAGASASFRSEPGRRSVASVLKDGGYRTAAFVSAMPLAKVTGVNAGFETYVNPNFSSGWTWSAAETNAKVLAWLDEEAPRPGPLFLWVHYFDPHEPNDPAAPYDTLFRTDERQLAWIGARRIDPSPLGERFGAEYLVPHFWKELPRGHAGPEGAESVDVTLELVADLMNRYDGELCYLDEQVGVLLDALRRHGRYEDAIVALAADHGQSLGENAWLGHGSITDVNTFVPLLVRFPRALVSQPRRVGALVSLADLMPTVLARFELPGSELARAQFQGEDVLSGTFARDNALTQRTADRVLDGETGPQFALYSGSWKLIHRPEGSDELYDLSGAGEFVDVSSEHPDVVRRLRADVTALLARNRARAGAATATPDAELLRSLEELGYGGDDE